MIQLRTGDLIAVRRDDAYVLFAILTRQILFGGHWSFVFRHSRKEDDGRPAPDSTLWWTSSCQNAKTASFAISRGNDFFSLMGPDAPCPQVSTTAVARGGSASARVRRRGRQSPLLSVGILTRLRVTLALLRAPLRLGDE